MQGGDYQPRLSSISRPAIGLRPGESQNAAAKTLGAPKKFNPTPPSTRRKVTQPVHESAPLAKSQKDFSVSQMLEAGSRQFSNSEVKQEGPPAQPPQRIHYLKNNLAAQAASAPKRMKPRGMGKSTNLVDIAFQDDDVGGTYAPISVPYFTEQTEGGGEEKVDKRPTLVNVDESNRNASSLFIKDDGSLRDDEYICIQLPSVMPGLASEAACANPMELPDGKIGRLLIYESGKVQLRMGDMLFNVDQGSSCKFAQDVAVVCPKESEIMYLGPVNARAVVTPDVDALTSLFKPD